MMQSPRGMPDPLADFPIVITVPLAWGDMDAYAHVNNTVYFRLFESARIEYLRAIEFTDGGTGGGIGPILASTHCRFRRPLAFPDTVRVGARTVGIDADRFTMEYVIVSEQLGEVAARGGGVIVSYDYGRGEKALLPEPVRRRMGEVARRAAAGGDNADGKD
jgi:acyl-CoA thioester hydrolase